MPDLEKMTGMSITVRRIQPIIYVIDTSGGMVGIRIADVNQTMHETMEVLKEVSTNNSDVELKIGILQFGTYANWVTGEDGLVSMEDFVWNDLEAGGLSDLGAALGELDNKLSRKAFLNSERGYKLPVIISLSLRCPSDDYQTALKNITENNIWFNAAIKIAIAMDDDLDIDVLTEITGKRESVIEVTDMETLKKLIKVVSVNAAKIGANSRVGTTEKTTNDILSDVKAEMGGDKNAIFFDPDPTPPTTVPPADTGGRGQ